MAANETVRDATASFRFSPDEDARLLWGVMKDEWVERARSLPDAMALPWTDEERAAHCGKPRVLAALSYA